MVLSRRSARAAGRDKHSKRIRNDRAYWLALPVARSCDERTGVTDVDLESLVLIQ